MHLIRKGKYTFYFVLLCFFITTEVIAEDNCLQKKISITSDTTIYSTLNAIGDTLGYYFSYNSKLFNAEEKIKIDVKDKTVKSILYSIFGDFDYVFQGIGNQIVISKKEEVLFKTYFKNTEPVKIQVSGVIYDKETAKPIPFATIGLLGKMNWSVCNGDGEYALKLDLPKYDDTLFISCLGYKNEKISLTDYFTDSVFNINLISDAVPIKEVVIRKIDPNLLLRRIIEKIPVNYPIKQSGFEGFYREEVFKNNHCVSVAEAIVEGRKSSYFNQNQNDQIKLVKGRKLIDEQRNDTVYLKLQSGIYTSLLLDIIKNPADFLSNEYFEDYSYKVENIILSDDHYTYVLGFDQKAESEFGIYKGQVFVDYEKSAIVNVDFELNKTGIKNASKYLIIKKPFGYKVRVEKAGYKVNYVMGYDSLYRLNYISNETTFFIKKERKLFGARYLVKSELAITDYLNYDVKRFNIAETVKQNEIFSELVDEYDPEFWSNYSIIPPEKSLLEAIKNFKKLKKP